MRISVMLDDCDFVDALVGVLRLGGHLVVEPEIAEVRISAREPPPEGVRIELAVSPADGQPLVVVLLSAPITVKRLASELHRLTPF